DDAVLLGLLDRCHHDLGGAAASLEALHERHDAVAKHVVAEVHHERVFAEEIARDEHRVREAERRLLLDVRNLQPPRRTVADRVAYLVAGLADVDARLAYVSFG